MTPTSDRHGYYGRSSRYGTYPSCACGWAADRGFDSPWAASVAWAGHIFDRSHQEAT